MAEGLRLAITTSGIIRLAGVWDVARWRQSCLFKRIGSLVAATPRWVIDDMAVPKKGTHSVGVVAQYASALGKTAQL